MAGSPLTWKAKRGLEEGPNMTSQRFLRYQDNFRQ